MTIYHVKPTQTFTVLGAIWETGPVRNKVFKSICGGNLVGALSGD